MRNFSWLGPALGALLMLAGGGAAAEGDAVAGKAVFAKRCQSCHTVAEGGKHQIGPNLWGVWGSAAGGRPNGFRYSDAMRAAGTERGIIWNEATLDAFITRPPNFVPETRMPFPGLPRPIERRNLIAYIKQATQP